MYKQDTSRSRKPTICMKGSGSGKRNKHTKRSDKINR